MTEPEAIRTDFTRLAQRGAATLAEMPRADLRQAWQETISLLRDPHTRAGSDLRDALRGATGLSTAGLDAALACVLDGVADAHADAVFATTHRVRDAGVAGVVLASNLPGLAVQPLLSALAVGRPLWIKSASAEPAFAPALVDVLCRHAPALRDAIATWTWTGGDVAVEAPLLTESALVVAYGDDTSVQDLAARARCRVIPFGAKISVAVVSVPADCSALATGLVRDIALFDQQGCLSIQAIYVLGDDHDARRLADAVAVALTARAASWPMGRIDDGRASAVQQLRGATDLSGGYHPRLPLTVGTVVVDPDPRLQPSPGLRTVRIHPISSDPALLAALAPWRGKLQGMTLAVGPAQTHALVRALTSLGVSRIASPGQLQRADTTWNNGGVDLTRAFSDPGA